MQLIKAVWTYVLTSWSLCNRHLHQDTGYTSIPDYQQAVKTLYETGSQLPPDACAALFQCPLQEMLEQPPAILCTWLECSHQYMKQQFKAAKTRAKLRTPDIRSFFHPKPANDLHPPRKPYYTAPVWVFLVQIRHREITLKQQVFFENTSLNTENTFWPISLILLQPLSY